MTVESKDLIQKILNNEIEELKSKEESLKTKLNKLLINFDTRDIDKLNEISLEINIVKSTIINLYCMSGGIDARIEKAQK